MNKLSNMPDWLANDEEYTPVSDKDTFINKTVLALLGILSRIKYQGNKTDIFGLDASLKVVFTILLIAITSISKSFIFVIIIGVYLLLQLSLLQGEEILKILKVSFVVTGFALIILLPALFYGNSYSCIMISSKVFTNVTAVGILSNTTKWTGITGAFKRFFIPDLFILVFDITIKYIVMLGEFSLSMLYSLKLRSVGRNRSKYTSLSGIAGTMFIKSREMAEEMYSAMELRGFTGEYKIIRKSSRNLSDFIYIAINLAIFIIFVYFERLK